MNPSLCNLLECVFARWNIMKAPFESYILPSSAFAFAVERCCTHCSIVRYHLAIGGSLVTLGG